VKLKKSSVVSNAGPLIHLSKIGLLHLLKKLYAEVVIPAKVKFEVVDQGKKKGFPDALLIEKAIEEGWITVKEVKTNKSLLSSAKTLGLEEAEIEVIQYAYQTKATALIDDEAAREFARILGVTVRGSLGVLLEGLKRGILTRKEALKKLDELSEVMYISMEVYKLVRRKLEENKNQFS